MIFTFFKAKGLGVGKSLVSKRSFLSVTETASAAVAVRASAFFDVWGSIFSRNWIFVFVGRIFLCSFLSKEIFCL